MLRRVKGILALTLALGSIGGVSQAADRIKWGQTWELSPLEHKRLRAKGLTDHEVYVIATIVSKTNYDPDFLANGIFRGITLPMAGTRVGMTQEEMNQRRPEWGTPAWEEAVKRGDPFWHPPVPGPSR